VPKVKKNSASANARPNSYHARCPLRPCSNSAHGGQFREQVKIHRSFTESVVEQATLAWLESLGWSVTHGLQIAPGEPGAERADYASHRFTHSTGAGAPA
jgi:hypothetical protein